MSQVPPPLPPPAGVPYPAGQPPVSPQDEKLWGMGAHLGMLLTAIINFLLVAAVVYFFIVAPMNKFNKMREAKLETPAEEEVTEADLLTEIRDLLAQQTGTPDAALNKNIDGDLTDGGAHRA